MFQYYSSHPTRFPSNVLAIAISATVSLAFLFGVLLISGHFTQPVCAAALPVAVSQQPVVVELFTSEGCSSCPPADALLQQLDTAQAQGSQPVIVLSEHVTYWNNLGWRDPFSSEAMTQRQNEYGNRFGLSSVYTPQAVVDGSIELVGSDRAKLVRAVESAATKAKISLMLEGVQWSGDAVIARISAASEVPPATLVVALADDSDKSNVLRGENGGRGLQHVSVVRNLVELRRIKGAVNQQPIRINLPSGIAPQPKMRLVAFLADNRNGHILGAAMQTLNR
jgi:hypothetical protein